MYDPTADFSDWFRLKVKSRKTFDIISTKSAFLKFPFWEFWGGGCSPAAPPPLLGAPLTLAMEFYFQTKRRRSDADCTTLPTLIPVGMPQTPAVGAGYNSCLRECFSTGGMRATGGTTRSARYNRNLANNSLYCWLIIQGDRKVPGHLCKKGPALCCT
jgi:hypothetical protein